MGNEIKVFVGGTEYRLTDPGAQAEIDTWKARAEKAERQLVNCTAYNMLLKDALEATERERDEARDGVKGKSAEIARLDSLLAQVVDERDDAKAKIAEMRDALAAAKHRWRFRVAHVCRSCEGPLTCAKCTAKEHPSSRLNDHEARIKALESRVILEMEE
jgi:chromosome segregation ATPase